MANRKFNIHKRYKIQLPSLLTILVNLCIGLIIGYLGPFGSYELPTNTRILYWVILIGVGQFTYIQIDNFFQWYFEYKTIHKIIAFTIPSLFSAFILSFFVEYASYYFINLELAFPENFIFFFPKVFVLGLALNTFGTLFNQSKYLSVLDKKKNKPGQDFLNRIPKNLRDDLVCFCMEDHYLKVYTDTGNHMMLLRMKDALVELKDYPGLQVHRSWWIAIDAVIKVKKGTRKATLIMKNNIEVPVSQKYLSIIKQAGLF